MIVRWTMRTTPRRWDSHNVFVLVRLCNSVLYPSSLYLLWPMIRTTCNVRYFFFFFQILYYTWHTRKHNNNSNNNNNANEDRPLYTNILIQTRYSFWLFSSWFLCKIRTLCPCCLSCLLDSLCISLSISLIYFCFAGVYRDVWVICVCLFVYLNAG